jgi:hypothetical protein
MRIAEGPRVPVGPVHDTRAHSGSRKEPNCDKPRAKLRQGLGAAPAGSALTEILFGAGT